MQFAAAESEELQGERGVGNFFSRRSVHAAAAHAKRTLLCTIKSSLLSRKTSNKPHRFVRLPIRQPLAWRLICLRRVVWGVASLQVTAINGQNDKSERTPWFKQTPIRQTTCMPSAKQQSTDICLGLAHQTCATSYFWASDLGAQRQKETKVQVSVACDHGYVMGRGKFSTVIARGPLERPKVPALVIWMYERRQETKLAKG